MRVLAGKALPHPACRRPVEEAAGVAVGGEQRLDFGSQGLVAAAGFLQEGRAPSAGISRTRAKSSRTFR